MFPLQQACGAPADVIFESIVMDPVPIYSLREYRDEVNYRE